MYVLKLGSFPIDAVNPPSAAIGVERELVGLNPVGWQSGDRGPTVASWPISFLAMPLGLPAA